MDLESLERQNDDGIAALGERVGLLKNVRAPAEVLAGRPRPAPQPPALLALLQITGGIHSEVDTQHRVLDGMVGG